MSDQNAVTKAQPPKMPPTMPLAKVTSLQDAFDHPDFAKRVAGAVPKTMSPDRMIRTFVQACHRTPLLVKVPVMQLVGAFMTCALVGLEPNTPLQHCHLIPFQKRKFRNGSWEVVGVELNLIFGYPGLLDLSFRSGMVINVHADVVWPNDDFSFSYGTGGHLRHRPTGQHQGSDRPIQAYMHATLRGGGEGYEVMPYHDVLMIRNSSQGYQSALRARDEAEKKGWSVPGTYTEVPWVKHEIAMARKTVFRAGSKWLPRSIELAAALQIDEAQDRRLVDFGAAVIDQDAITIGLPHLPEDDEGGRSDDGGSLPVSDQRSPADTSRTERDTGRGGAPTQERTIITTQQTSNGRRAPVETVGSDNASSGPPPGHPAADDPDPAADAVNETIHNPPTDASAEDGAGGADGGGGGEFYYMSDEFGEPIEGPDGAISDPYQFIAALRRRWEGSTSRSNLLENNQDAIDAAIAESAEARQFFITTDWSDSTPPSKITNPTKTSSPETPKYPLSLPQKGGRTDFVATTNLVRATLAKLSTIEGVVAFDDAHRPIFDKFPAVSKTNIRAIIDAKKGELGADVSDPDQEWLDRIKDSLHEYESQRDLRAALSATAYATRLQRIEREKPAMYAAFRDAVKEVDARLGAQGRPA